MNNINTLVNEIKRSWKDSRAVVESNGKTVAENEAEARAWVINSWKNPMDWFESIAIWGVLPYACKKLNLPWYVTLGVTTLAGEAWAYSKHTEEYKEGWRLLKERIARSKEQRAEMRRQTDALMKSLDDLGASHEERMEKFRFAMRKGTDDMFANLPKWDFSGLTDVTHIGNDGKPVEQPDDSTVQRIRVQGSYQLFSDSPAQEWITEKFEAAKDMGLIEDWKVMGIDNLNFVVEIHFWFVTTGVSTKEDAKMLADMILDDTDSVVHEVTPVKVD